MATSPPDSPSPAHKLQRPLSAIATRPQPRSTSRLSMNSKQGGESRASDEDNRTAVRVAVRVRPALNPEDPGYDLIPQRFQRPMVHVTSNTSLSIDSPQGRKLFVFDRVFGPDVMQDGIWEYLTDSINAFTQGYNVSLLAYGQSGAGKSYTMGTASATENPDDMGVIPRAAAALFEKLDQNNLGDRNWALTATYVEIYNETLRDLLVADTTPLNDRTSVAIREDVKGNIILTGLHQVDITCVDDLLNALAFGSSIRQTDATAINAKSSRSHAVFSLNLVQRKNKFSNSDKRHSMPLEAMSGQDISVTTDSKLHFVDLAGSERLKNTGAQGERAKEGISINAGLAALGKDSLGGNAITYMIACVTPPEFHLSETLNTVQYAQRARAIQSKPRIQQVEEGDKNAIIERLKAEVAFLREQIRSANGQGDLPPRSANRSSERSERQNEREAELQNQLLDLQENYGTLNNRHARLIAEMAKARESEHQHHLQLDELQEENATDRLNRSNSFAQSVEQVVLEYEKTIQTLEQSLSKTRTTLSNTETNLLEKETKCAYVETINSQLQSRIQKLMDREASTESYLHDLEAKLDGHSTGEEKNSAIIVELRKEITRIRENESASEDYISTLEERLAEADQDAELMQREIERLEQVIERQRSLGKLDALLHELDHVDESKLRDSDDSTKAESADGHDRQLAQDKDQENEIEEATSKLAPVVENDEDAVIAATNQAFAQSKFVADKLELVTRELFDLRTEHETTVHDYGRLHAKYEEAMRKMSELQDTIDEARYPDRLRHSIISVDAATETRPESFQSVQTSYAKDDIRSSAHRSLSSELSSVMDSPITADTTHLDLESEDDTATAKPAASVEDLTRELAQHVELHEQHGQDELEEQTEHVEQHEQLESKEQPEYVEKTEDVAEHEHVQPVELKEPIELKAQVEHKELAEPVELVESKEVVEPKEHVEHVEQVQAQEAQQFEFFVQHDDAEIQVPAEQYEQADRTEQNEQLAMELERLRVLAEEKENAERELAVKYAQLELKHNETLDMVEELKTEVTKARTVDNGPRVIRRKSSQNLLGVDRAQRSFVYLRNLAAENFEGRPETMQSFELNLNSAMHELQSRSERIQELESDVAAAKKEMESKMAIISGLARERSSLKASPVDMSMVATLRGQLEQSERQLYDLREAHAVRERELTSEVEVLRKSVASTPTREFMPSDEEEADVPYNERVSTLQAELAGWENKHHAALVSMRSTEKEMQATIQQLEAQVDAANAQLAESQSRAAAEKDADAEEAKKEVVKQQELIEFLRQEIDEYKAVISSNNAKVAELESLHLSARAAMDDMSKIHSSVTAETTARHQELSAKLEELIASHEDATKAHQEEMDALKQSHARELAELKDHEQTSYEKQVEVLMTEHSEAIFRLETDLAQSRDELTRVATQIAAVFGAEMPLEKLGERIEALVANQNAVEAERKKMGELTSHVTELSNINESLVRDLEGVKTAIAGLLPGGTEAKAGPLVDQLAAVKAKVEDLDGRNKKNSRLIEELEEQLQHNFDEVQVTNNRLSSLQSERNAQLDEALSSRIKLQTELETVREEYAALQIKYNEMANGDVKRSNSNSTIRKSSSHNSLPSPPPSVPLPPLPNGAPSSPTSTRPPSKDNFNISQVTEDQEARIRAIEKHLSAERQLTQTLEEALGDLEKQSKKVKADCDAWKKRAQELEAEVKELKEKSSDQSQDNRYSMQAVEEERKKRQAAEAARKQLEERMQAISKNKKKKGSLNCF
ncbi:kinesin motor domain-containing protein [Trichoderma breve]|uniref:Kinesin motor domain-containing protein n=1 Tax=Trichoderma breve TaxID=2034170 RepID=A0A9W9E628_9HYPO|nr:kinesin motor domain-containing protein [Trichoderma breve]KAJ4857917.1 kinesin motor domain-containing protein [Trichoderma breve]